MERVPHYIREHITTEYSSICSNAIELFTKIAMKQLDNITMYPLNVFGNVQYKEHYSKTVNDVQIIFDYIKSVRHDVAGNLIYGHSKCIYYKASVKKVYVYDSAMTKNVTQREGQIINILYPFNKGILFKRPKIVQDHHPTCGIYTIAYATMLLLGQDPTKTEIRLNEVHGDKTILMRIHLLNMFVNRKIKSFK